MFYRFISFVIHCECHAHDQCTTQGIVHGWCLTSRECGDYKIFNLGFIAVAAIQTSCHIHGQEECKSLNALIRFAIELKRGHVHGPHGFAFTNADNTLDEGIIQHKITGSKRRLVMHEYMRGVHPKRTGTPQGVT